MIERTRLVTSSFHPEDVIGRSDCGERSRTAKCEWIASSGQYVSTMSEIFPFIESSYIIMDIRIVPSAIVQPDPDVIYVASLGFRASKLSSLACGKQRPCGYCEEPVVTAFFVSAFLP